MDSKILLLAGLGIGAFVLMNKKGGASSPPPVTTAQQQEAEAAIQEIINAAQNPVATNSGVPPEVQAQMRHLIANRDEALAKAQKATGILKIGHMALAKDFEKQINEFAAANGLSLGGLGRINGPELLLLKLA